MKVRVLTTDTEKTIPLEVPVSVRVKGGNGNTWIKNVALALCPKDESVLLVKSGRRGRPARLALDSIVTVHRTGRGLFV